MSKTTSNSETHPKSISFNSLFRGNATSTVILDGGLGTTLEDHFHIPISDNPLWSAKAIMDNPDVIVKAHSAFFDAGSDIISTATYQCSHMTFSRAGLTTVEEEIAVMRRAVALANEARNSIDINDADTRTNHFIALSLGAFGATLTPTQEFDGIYPPPYGSPSPRNDVSYWVENAIEALAVFHYDRLCVFTEDEYTWSTIDCIAFETIPVTREIIATRKAMARLGDTRTMKPWWISTVYPNGVFPEVHPDGKHLEVRDVVQALFGGDLPRPSAVGINCTAVEYLPQLVNEMAMQLAESDGIRPWLVLYPNGGDVYDSVARTWICSKARDNGSGSSSWSEKIATVAKMVSVPTGVWEGLIVGGCCRTSPEDIELLRRAINNC